MFHGNSYDVSWTLPACASLGKLQPMCYSSHDPTKVQSKVQSAKTEKRCKGSCAFECLTFSQQLTPDPYDTILQTPFMRCTSCSVRHLDGGVAVLPKGPRGVWVCLAAAVFRYAAVSTFGLTSVRTALRVLTPAIRVQCFACLIRSTDVGAQPLKHCQMTYSTRAGCRPLGWFRT